MGLEAALLLPEQIANTADTGRSVRHDRTPKIRDLPICNIIFLLPLECLWPE